MIPRPDTISALKGLKDFQRTTVDYVFQRFYGANPTRRFLVADEVGLGKTLVARGVIARRSIICGANSRTTRRAGLM